MNHRIIKLLKSVVVLTAFFAIDKSYAQSLESALKKSWDLAPTYISTSNTQNCTLSITNAYCWGNKGLELILENNKIPTLISAAEGNTCALFDTELFCWSETSKKKVLNLSKVTNARSLSVSKNHACFIGENEFLCWNRERTVYKKITRKNPIQIVTSTNLTCTLDEKGVSCWEGAFYVKRFVPELKSPKFIAAGEFHACAIDNSDVVCWFINNQNNYRDTFKTKASYDRGQIQKQVLKNPKAVAAGLYHTCALHELGVKCWGDNTHKQLEVPPLINPTSLSASDLHTCAIDAEGVKCWGNSESGFNTSPEDLTAKSIPESCKNILNDQIKFQTCKMAHKGLEQTKKYLYKSKREVAQQTINIINTYPEDSYFILYALKPFVESLTAKAHIEFIIPNFTNSLEQLDKFYKVKDLSYFMKKRERDLIGLNIISMLLKSLESSIDNLEQIAVLKELAIFAQKLQFESQKMKPYNNDSIRKFTTKLNEYETMFQSLENNPDSQPMALAFRKLLKEYFGSYK